jgi:hypothetical protein
MKKFILFFVLIFILFTSAFASDTKKMSLYSEMLPPDVADEAVSSVTVTVIDTHSISITGTPTCN